MSTVAEIEKAIEHLPTTQMLEIADWIDTQRIAIASSETIFQMLDAEEGEGAGQQWIE